MNWEPVDQELVLMVLILLRLKVFWCFISDLVKEVRAIRGFDKNEIGKVILVGPGSRACHVLLYSIYFNSILASGGNGRAIGLVLGVNWYFLKFRGWSEKGVIV